MNGKYTFSLTSDEGSRLTIDGTRVVNNDGLYSASERSGSVKLSPGCHRIQVIYFEKSGSEQLTVQIAGPGLVKQVIPPGMLSTGY